MFASWFVQLVSLFAERKRGEGSKKNDILKPNQIQYKFMFHYPLFSIDKEGCKAEPNYLCREMFLTLLMSPQVQEG